MSDLTPKLQIEANTAEIRAQVELLKELADREGKYVWKKSEILSNGGTLSITHLTSGVDPTQIKVASNDIDLTKVDESFFVGMKGSYHTTPYEYEFKEGNIWYISTTDVTKTYSYDPATQIISIHGWASANIYAWTDIEVGVTYGEVDYVVADDESSYPNGAIHTDGYYYEKGESGACVWGKYESVLATVENPTFTATTNTSLRVYKISSTSFDPTKVTAEFFDGFKDQYSCEFKWNGTALIWTSTVGTEYTVTYEPSTCLLTFSSNINNTLQSGSYSGIKLLEYDSAFNFLDYVVSDDETAYPDGALQDGYWYERGEGLNLKLLGCSKFAVDNYVSSADVSTSTDIPHSLGEIPKYIFITTSETVSSSTTRGYLKEYVLTPWQRTSFYYSGTYTTGNVSSAKRLVEPTENSFQLGASGYLKAGVEYQIITMA